MVPCSFEESNNVLNPPPGMTDNCEPLSVLHAPTQHGMPTVVSCWKLTKEELEEINRTGRVWLTVYGLNMPPVSLTVEKPFTT